MVGNGKQDLKSRKAHVLRMHYGALDIARQFAAAGNWRAVAEYETIAADYLTRLRYLKFLEVYHGWPQLLPAAPSPN